MNLATRNGDTEMQQYLLKLMNSELDRSRIYVAWSEGDIDGILEMVYPPELKSGNGNGR